MMQSSLQCKSGVSLLVQIFMSMACRFLFTKGENAYPTVMTWEENSFVAKNLLYLTVLLYSSYLL